MLVLTAILHVDAAHSRRRITVFREQESYDRVITDFNPEGRLSQVEYGMEASRRGSTIAAALQTGEEGFGGICVVIQNSSFGKMHRIDHHIWLATAGLSGDSRHLANHLRVACQNYRMRLGEAPTTKQVARMAGRYQHYLTRAGGIRPLGCAALVIGVDPSENEEKLGHPRLFQTDAGGVAEECRYCTLGRGQEAIGKDLSSLLDRKPIPANLTTTAEKMTQTVLGKLEGPKTVDVWTIEPCRGKRGGLLATCHRQIDKGSTTTLQQAR